MQRAGVNQHAQGAQGETRRRRFSICIALFVSLVAGFHGIIALITRTRVTPGQYNPLIGPPLLVTMLLLCSVLFSRRGSREPARTRFIARLIAATAMSMAPMILFGVRGDTVKLLRDLTFVLFTTSSFLVAFELSRRRLLDATTFLLVILATLAFTFPLVAKLFGIGSDDGRFGSLSLSYPVFGNSLALVAVFALSVVRSRTALIVVSLGLAVSAIASGSRTSLLLIGLVVASAMVLSKDRRGNITSLSRSRLGILIVLGSVSIQPLLWSSIRGASSTRALDLSDFEFGSTATRLLLYEETWSRIAATGLLGGYGAGSIETLQQYLTHFDILRFWHDYSALTAVSFAVLATLMCQRAAGVQSWRNNNLFKVLKFGLYMAAFIVFNVHNAFQSPDMVLLFGTLLGIAAGVSQQRASLATRKSRSTPPRGSTRFRGSHLRLDSTKAGR